MNLDVAVVGTVALVVAGLAGIILAYQLFVVRSRTDYRSLMARSGESVELPNGRTVAEVRERIRGDKSGEELERLKRDAKRKLSKKQALTLDERFFQAGIFTDKQKADFHRLRVLAPPVAVVFLFLMTYQIGGDLSMGLLGAVLGLLVGFQLPSTVLDRKVKARGEEIMFYLPLVIEQIAIGVSSSLDIGPCLQRVVTMADERDTHNVVTELVRHAQFHVKSGASLEEAMTEVGKLSGHTELKHAFMSLAQVAKHGGEITRQLQELADAVSMQRETRIEERIKKLELEATGPVAFVFVGFMIILLVGFGLQIQGAF